VLSVATRAFDDPVSGSRMKKSVLRWSRRQAPTAFDSALGSLTLQLTLVVLDGVASRAFDVVDGARHGPVSAWWVRRRLAVRLRRRRALEGTDSMVPVVGASRAERIAGEVRRLAQRAGLTESEAQRFAWRLTELLTDTA
jgi:hypothetical protein